MITRNLLTLDQRCVSSRDLKLSDRWTEIFNRFRRFWPLKSRENSFDLKVDTKGKFLRVNVTGLLQVFSSVEIKIFYSIKTKFSCNAL